MDRRRERALELAHAHTEEVAASREKLNAALNSRLAEVQAHQDAFAEEAIESKRALLRRLTSEDELRQGLMARVLQLEADRRRLGAGELWSTA